MTNPISLPAAVLFDLDDTLLNYGECSRRAWDMVSDEFAGAAGVTAGELHDAFSTASAEFWADPARHRAERVNMFEARRKVIAAALRAIGAHSAGLELELTTRRSRLALDLLEFFPGALQVVRELHDAGVKLGMVTNGTASEQHAKIERFGLREFFRTIMVEGEFGRGKPDHECFQHVLAGLGVAPADAWMVGDNLAMDIAPSRELGLHAVWHDWRAAGLPADAPCEPHRTITKIGDLLRA